MIVSTGALCCDVVVVGVLKGCFSERGEDVRKGLGGGRLVDRGHSGPAWCSCCQFFPQLFVLAHQSCVSFLECKNRAAVIRNGKKKNKLSQNPVSSDTFSLFPAGARAWLPDGRRGSP